MEGSVPAERYQGSVAGLALMLLAATGFAPSAIMEMAGVKPLGYTKKGDPIWPMAGGDGATPFDQTMQELLGEMRKANGILESEGKKPEDGGRKAAAIDGTKEVAGALDDKTEAKEIEAQKAARLAALEGHVEALARLQRDRGRSVSKARDVAGDPGARNGSRMKAQAWVTPHPAMAANWSDYIAGEFLTGLQDVRNLSEGFDPAVQARGKAKLEELGVAFADLPATSQSYGIVDGNGKATLGTTSATGGYTLPNNLVDTVVKKSVQKAVLQSLVTVINGVSVRGVDMPFRHGQATRMTFQNWGELKEKVDSEYGVYTAVLGTLARIMDISKQYARLSAGAAEKDIMDELTRSAILGENYYMLMGAGTGTLGVGDPTYGVYTALAAASAFNGYTTAHTAVGTTLAGSAAVGFATAMGALASRGREAEAIVTDAVSFWSILAQGTDAAGFWQSPTGGPTGFTKTNDGGIAYWNVPMFYDRNLNDITGTTKRAILGEWSALKLYRGMEFRIDSSDIAGERWDRNLIGFRGEEEIGFHAGPAVSMGAMQLLTGIIP